MAEHHPTLSPSALPMLAECPCFERAEVEEDGYADRGLLLHRVFEAQMRGEKPVEADRLSLAERESLKWAVDYTKLHAADGYPLELEQKLVLMDGDFNIVTFGTGDVVNGPRMFDLKSGDYHDYFLQIAAYGLMQMDRIEQDRIDFHVLFLRHKHAHTLTILREDAHRRVFKVIESVMEDNPQPRANPYCKWCRKVMTCKAVKRLVDGTDTETYVISEPEELSDALTRVGILKQWCTRVEQYAKEQAIAGMSIPRFMLKSRSGARQIMDVKLAYEKSGVDPNRFLAICNVPIGAIEDLIAETENITKTNAKKIVNERLAEAIQRRPPTVHLTPTKYDEPTEK